MLVGAIGEEEQEKSNKNDKKVGTGRETKLVGGGLRRGEEEKRSKEETKEKEKLKHYVKQK